MNHTDKVHLRSHEIITTRIRKSKVYEEKRQCTHPGCTIKLNKYHPGDRCYLHE